MAETAVLEVERLTKSFGGLMAVNEVSFRVVPGEIFGLIGPNGAGKTTAFNLFTGLYRASSGEVRIAGSPVVERKWWGLRVAPPNWIAALGVARTFQNTRLFATLSVLENVMIARHLHCAGARDKTAAAFGFGESERVARAKAMEVLALVGLEGRALARAGALPYGDQRRLEIARAIAALVGADGRARGARLLMLDEPAAGMNPAEKAGLAQLVRSLRDRFDLTVLIIEHHVPLVMGLCGRVAVLNFGHLIALGSPSDVRNDVEVVKAYLGQRHAENS